MGKKRQKLFCARGHGQDLYLCIVQSVLSPTSPMLWKSTGGDRQRALANSRKNGDNADPPSEEQGISGARVERAHVQKFTKTACRVHLTS